MITKQVYYMTICYHYHYRYYQFAHLNCMLPLVFFCFPSISVLLSFWQPAQYYSQVTSAVTTWNKLVISLAKIKAKKCLDHTKFANKYPYHRHHSLWVRYPFVSISSRAPHINGPHNLHNTTGTTWMAKSLKKFFVAKDFVSWNYFASHQD